MPENFCGYVNYCEEDGKPEWCPLKQNKRGLEWVTPEKGRENTWNKLYIAYQPGYPLMIADWRTGYGYRDVRTGESIDPVMVAYINLPVETRWDQIGRRYNDDKSRAT
jgi:hypothetical protein